MKYERLTPKTLLSDVLKEYRLCCYGEPTIEKFGGHGIVELIDRLVEIEDKIESGEIDYVSDRDKGIARLTAENQRLREEAAEQKSIAEYEHATQMEWFRIACDYKAENAELRARLEKAVELQFSNGDEVYAIMDTLLYTGVIPVTIKSADVVYEVFDGEQITTQHRTRIFATRAEAEARLKEIKENNND